MEYSSLLSLRSTCTAYQQPCGAVQQYARILCMGSRRLLAGWMPGYLIADRTEFSAFPLRCSAAPFRLWMPRQWTRQNGIFIGSFDSATAFKIIFRSSPETQSIYFDVRQKSEALITRICERCAFGQIERIVFVVSPSGARSLGVAFR